MDLLTPFCLQAVNDRKNELFQKAHKAYLAQKAQLLAATEELRKVKSALAAASAKPAEVDQLKAELEKMKQQLLKAQGKFWVCPLLLPALVSASSGQLTRAFAQPMPSKSPA